MIIKEIRMVKGGFTMHIEYCRDGKDFEIEITPKMAIDNYEAVQEQERIKQECLSSSSGEHEFHWQEVTVEACGYCHFTQ